jgi:ABC-2 type transport system ATP-binding protein
MPSTPANSPACELEARGLRKSFGQSVVLRGLDLAAASGEKILLLGSNGAGKSTLLRILAGLVTPDAGSVVRAAPREAVGYVGHNLLLYRHLTVWENLKFFGDLTGSTASAIEAELERWALSDVKAKMLGEISRGQQFRLAVCRALVAKPRYLFLDEPTSAFDDRSVENLFEAIESCVGEGGRGVAVIASHDIARVREKIDRVVVLRGGEIATDSARSSIEEALTLYREVNR